MFCYVQVKILVFSNKNLLLTSTVGAYLIFVVKRKILTLGVILIITDALAVAFF